MRVLVLGGDGMLGHRLLASMVQRHEVRVTLRQDLAAYEQFGLFTHENSFAGVDLRAPDRLSPILAEFHPQIVVNAVGIVKQRPDAEDHVVALEINSLLPHRLAVICHAVRARLIHISTDCVFSGKRGNYREDDLPDARDLYGRSKLLGEASAPPALTLRTSMIGRELSRKTGLLEWFLAQRAPVKGFCNAIFSGLTTNELARLIEMMIVKFPDAAGLYHVSSEPISKYDLLRLIRDKLGLSTEIRPGRDFPLRSQSRFNVLQKDVQLLAASMEHDGGRARGGNARVRNMIFDDKKILVTGGTGSMGRPSCGGR